MSNYNFSFFSSYHGFWCVPGIGESIPGNLYIDKISIRLELFWDDRKSVNTGKFKLIMGYAYPTDSVNKTCYYFNLKEIYLYYVSFFGRRQSQFKFDIGSFFISENKNYDLSKVNNACIRTQLFDKWVWDYTSNSYNSELPIKSNRISFSYEQPKSLTLFENNQIKVYIHFGYGFSMPNESGCILTTHAFLNIYNKQNKLFEDSLEIAQYLYDLFSLLFGNVTPPDFMEFRCVDAKFIYKRSPKLSYQFVNYEESSVQSSLVDFIENNKLEDVIKNWLSLSSNEKYAVLTYFETIRDEHIPLSSSIKNYISVIEGLSEGLKIKSFGQNKGTKKERRLIELLDKTQGLSVNEKNEIKMLVTRESSKQPKLILKHIVKELSNLTDVVLEDDFCERAVNTRNYITHTNAKESKIYQKNEYWDVSFALENIIAAFLLSKIGVNNQIISKIIPEIKCKSITK